MLRGENMQFQAATFIWIVFVHLFVKFYENDNIEKLKPRRSKCVRITSAD